MKLLLACLLPTSCYLALLLAGHGLAQVDDRGLGTPIYPIKPWYPLAEWLAHKERLRCALDFPLVLFSHHSDCLCAYRISVHHPSYMSPLNDALVQKEIHVTVQMFGPTLEGAKQDPLQQIIIYTGSWTNKSRVTHEPA